METGQTTIAQLEEMYSSAMKILARHRFGITLKFHTQSRVLKTARSIERAAKEAPASKQKIHRECI